MTTFPGDFIVPPSQAVPGQITVYDWAKCRVLINKQVMSNVIDSTCTRSADIYAGAATIHFLDVDKSLYDSINPGDELEIYLSEQSPLTYGNKVWGGFVETREYDLDKKAILIVRGKEYTQGLVLRYTAASVVANHNSFTATEPGTAIKALMSYYQEDFSTDNVLTGTTGSLTADFLNKSLFDCLSTICQQFSQVFYINLDKDLVTRSISTIVATPASDYLTYTDNMYSIKEEDNKELLCNDIIVYGSAGTVSNSGAPLTDATSITAYGQHAKRIIVASLTTNTDCTNFANSYLAVYKDPLKQYKTESRLVAYSDPLMYITVTSDQSNISGQYQIREITHVYDKKGIRTMMTLSRKISDLSISLGQLMARVQAVEIETFA